MKTRSIALILLAAASVNLASAAENSLTVNSIQPLPAYPLQKSGNGRYLVDSKGLPFLIAGDAPQALMIKLKRRL